MVLFALLGGPGRSQNKKTKSCVLVFMAFGAAGAAAVLPFFIAAMAVMAAFMAFNLAAQPALV